jgi:hypothetical protein
MTATPEEKNNALVAALVELDERYPPKQRLQHYPVDTITKRTYTVDEVMKREDMKLLASRGHYLKVAAVGHQSGIPSEMLSAIIALIYK